MKIIGRTRQKCMGFMGFYCNHVTRHKSNGFLLDPYLGCATCHQINLRDLTVSVWLIDSFTGVANRDGKIGVPRPSEPSFVSGKVRVLKSTYLAACSLPGLDFSKQTMTFRIHPVVSQPSSYPGLS